MMHGGAYTVLLLPFGKGIFLVWVCVGSLKMSQNLLVSLMPAIRSITNFQHVPRMTLMPICQRYCEGSLASLVEARILCRKFVCTPYRTTMPVGPPSGG